MASPSPPKPWERGGGASAAMPTTTTTTTASSSSPPALPTRPDTLSSVVNHTAANYSNVNANRYGASPYGMGMGGGIGGYGSYSSPYSRFGGMGSMYGGGYGSMGGMGGMGGMYGMNGMYGMGGMPGDPNNPSLTQSFSNSTQATFHVIESIVGAFGGFAQMLESTYMATHSSFFAMVSVAEQFGNLRQTLGSVLGIFALMRWFRAAIAKLTGRPLPARSKDLTPSKFASFSGRMPDGSPTPPRASRKPFVMFILAVFGLPYLMGKFIRALAKSQEEEQRRRLEANPDLANGGAAIDVSKLEFYRVMYDFQPDANSSASVDLAVKKNDLVAVISKTDPMGNPSEWWRCRSRDGRLGYLPSPYLELVQKRTAQITTGSQAGSLPSSRAQTMTATASEPASRASTITDAKGPIKVGEKHVPQAVEKASEITVDSFQKSHFYS